MSSSNGVTFSVKISNYFQIALLAFLTIKTFFSSLYEYNIFKIIENVLSVFNGILSTVYCLAMIIAIIIICLYIFTSIVDEIDYSFSSNQNKLKIWIGRILNYSRNILFIVLTSMTGHLYLSTLGVIIFILEIATFFFTSKVRVKSAILSLSGREKSE